jgi:hypothetical protein
MLQAFMGIFDHDDGGIHHRADRNGDPPQAHDVGADAEDGHDAEGHQNARRQCDDRNQCTASVEQEDEADQSHHDAFLDQRRGQRVDGAADHLGAVIDRHDADPLGKTVADLSQPRL